MESEESQKIIYEPTEDLRKAMKLQKAFHDLSEDSFEKVINKIIKYNYYDTPVRCKEILLMILQVTHQRPYKTYMLANFTKKLLEEIPNMKEVFHFHLYLNHMMIVVFLTYGNNDSLDCELSYIFQLQRCIGFDFIKWGLKFSVLNIGLGYLGPIWDDLSKWFQDIEQLEFFYVDRKFSKTIEVVRARFGESDVISKRLYDLLRRGLTTNTGIARIIKKDDIESLQQISTQENFDFDTQVSFNQWDTEQLFNKKDVPIVDIAAYFGSVKCFKFIYMNGVSIRKLTKIAIAGGNIEIIRLAEQKAITFKGTLQVAIKHRHQNIARWLIENKPESYDNNMKQIFVFICRYDNIELFFDYCNIYEFDYEICLNIALKYDAFNLLRYFKNLPQYKAIDINELFQYVRAFLTMDDQHYFRVCYKERLIREQASGNYDQRIEVI
ncbi:hypothetical protein TRFO_01030 [Tritrichomonas foetus]|uniref:DUF3447 domain-containing protein n=1 Tax=Tritrichomonas foetus TaxID=1144522 RepID=A0A1J4KNZ3_9EUKA|nr:hypothetical protein TRFO_01030 [Tritrichomonas foetus]|eukprot:OHT11141.1 hypothetical protein TRFO_01030 [Tritrichomonas foetus]